MGLFDFFNKEKEIILGIEFPKFKGRKVYSNSKNTLKYKRKDYYFKQDMEKESQYRNLIISYGFSRVDEKKYIKANSYIIVENVSNRLHIAFHVVK